MFRGSPTQTSIIGTQADASDGRSCALLDTLLREHPELTEEFGWESANCRKAVQEAHEKLAEVERSVARSAGAGVEAAKTG